MGSAKTSRLMNAIEREGLSARYLYIEFRFQNKDCVYDEEGAVMRCKPSPGITDERRLFIPENAAVSL